MGDSLFQRLHHTYKLIGGGTAIPGGRSLLARLAPGTKGPTAGLYTKDPKIPELRVRVSAMWTRQELPHLPVGLVIGHGHLRLRLAFFAAFEPL
jgi:hypothetical protein